VWDAKVDNQQEGEAFNEISDSNNPQRFLLGKFDGPERICSEYEWSLFPYGEDSILAHFAFQVDFDKELQGADERFEIFHFQFHQHCDGVEEMLQSWFSCSISRDQ